MAAVRPLFLLIYLFFLTPGSNSAGYYGCKYSTSVCDQDEICVDDSWFGQCWSPFSADTPSEILLSDEQLDRLNRLLLSLISHGFTWNDLYSQCTIQKALDASDDVEDTEIVEYCQEATMVELNNEVAVLEGMIDEEIDELSQKEEELTNGNSLWSKRDEFVSRHKYKAPREETLRKTLSQLQRTDNEGDDDEDDEENETNMAGDNEIESFYGGLNDDDEDEEEDPFLNDSDDDSNDEDDGETAMTPQQFGRLLSLLNSAREHYDAEEEAEAEAEEPDFDSAFEDADYDGADDENEDDDDDNDSASIILKTLLAAADDDDDDEGNYDDDREADADDQVALIDDEDQIDEEIRNLSDDELNSLLNALDEDLSLSSALEEEIDDNDNDEYENAGLARADESNAVPLRAQKKDDNNEQVRVRVASPATEERGPDPAITLGVNDNRARSDQELSREIEASANEMNDIEKGWMGAAEKDKHYEVVRTDVVNIKVDRNFVDQDDAGQFVAEIEYDVGLAQGTLADIEFDHDHVTFRVRPMSHQRVNASLVRDWVDEAKDNILKRTGKRIVGVELTEKAILDGSVSAALTRDGHQLNNSIVATLSVCGAILGILLAVLAIFIARRQIERRRKLNEICSPIATDVEEGKATNASSYQDLCRTRMSVKAAESTTTNESPSSGKQRFFSGTSDSPSSARSSTSSWSEEPVAQSNMDISTGHIILSYMEDHIKNKDRLDEEWSALAQYEPDNVTTLVAQNEANVRKNRYSDILPYDHSRVKLNAEVNQHQSDFINASFVADNDPRHPAYVATQGPQPHTAADFWQMVWELGSVSIVNLSKLLDRGISYCHQYWPREGTEVYHTFEVNLVSEHIWCEDFLVRSFFLKNLTTNETRTVTQFHYLTWPENGVPALTKSVLDFRRKVKKSYKGAAAPTIVHCSDGVGRTGTYILLDMVLNKIARGGKEIDIAATLEYIRDQRPNMLKTKEQFDFVFAAVAEEVHAILKTIPQ